MDIVKLLKKLFITKDIEVIEARLPQSERALGRLADVGQLTHIFSATTIEQITLSSLARHRFNSAHYVRYAQFWVLFTIIITYPVTMGPEPITRTLLVLDILFSRYFGIGRLPPFNECPVAQKYENSQADSNSTEPERVAHIAKAL